MITVLHNPHATTTIPAMNYDVHMSDGSNHLVYNLSDEQLLASQGGAWIKSERTWINPQYIVWMREFTIRS